MTTAVFDTLKASRDLKAAGVGDSQAEAIVTTVARAFEDTVASKADIAELRSSTKSDLAEVKGELKQDIAEVKGELKQDIAEVKGELKQDIALVKGDIKLLKWMIGVVLACVAFPILKSFLV